MNEPDPPATTIKQFRTTNLSDAESDTLERRLTETAHGAGPSADFQALFDASPTPLLVVAPLNWTIVAANGAYVRATGKTREEQIGRHLFDVFPDDPDDPSADGVRNLTASLERVVATRSTDAMAVQRYAVQGPDGRFVERWWAPVNTPVLGKDGNVVLILHHVEDVSEVIRLRGDAEGRDQLAHGQQVVIDRLRTSQAALRESEARFRNMADNAPVMMWVTDPSGYCTYLNARWYEYTGQEPGVGEGYGWLNAVHPDDRPAAEQVFVSANAERRDYRVDFRLRRADGAYRWTIDAAAARFSPDGEFLGYVGSVIDIDERREAEERLAFSEEKLRLAIEVGEIGQWDVDHQTGAMFWPPRVKAMFGISPEVPVTLDNFHKGVHPDDREKTRSAYEAASDPDRRPLYDVEYRTIGMEDGVVRWVAAKGRGIFDGTGRCVRMIGTAVDITARKAAEMRLLDLNERLEHRVASEIADRAKAEEALRQSQKMEAVGQLTGGLAHDFNNLLAGISGSLELMQTRMQQGRFTDVDRYMMAAQGAAKRAAALTHRLLAFSRRQTLDPKPTDVNRLASGMEELIQRTVGPAITVEVIGAASLWPALVDPPQLENALLNLCINARDAMPDGGRITIETANKWLDERAARQHDVPEGQYLALSVTDTGIGMPPEVVERVFEPFFTTKPIGEGTGLGLSMIYGFAQQSGGQVRIYSEVGQGTTVCIYLPRHYGEVAADDGKISVTDLPRSEQGEAVLIVDDEPTVRMLVTDILEDLGYVAIEAGDSVAGLRVLQSDVRIDLLVTDVGLPGGMNGRQMADAARVTRPNLKVLFITGYAENAILGNGHLAPGMAVLTKPFAIETMAARIRSMIAAER
ncbi:PAS domain S-box protein [Methylobacterium sp.]|uniref:PAS domain-containing hybrid sensor histidine kinase/response regulator n=1 Tax=Methylobacterium sp. TaxID=409 RepID=UPI0025FD305B|nr:PAS domain S-box protein [Methylobacterium sp.]